MPEQSPKYDVAISFLVVDLSLAQALYNKLSEGLNVFFFPHNQEELVGTDGLESMREPFTHESRINLVLYRERWGHTPWTRVEETAIKDACLDKGWDGLLFFMVEPSSTPPKWLPRTHVRFNFGDFNLEQAVGAIKARVQELGGHYKPLTPLRKAEILAAEELFRRDKSQMSSHEGMKTILGKVEELLTEIERQCEQVNAGGNVLIECEKSSHACIMRHSRVGMIVRWQQQYTNTLEYSGLSVDEYNGRLLFNSELGRLMQFRRPDQIKSNKFEPDLSPSREYGWKPAEKSTPFLTSRTLAEKCILQFMDLIDRAASGKLRNPDML
jgi:hypothetical protein